MWRLLLDWYFWHQRASYCQFRFFFFFVCGLAVNTFHSSMHSTHLWLEYHSQSCWTQSKLTFLHVIALQFFPQNLSCSRGWFQNIFWSFHQKLDWYNGLWTFLNYSGLLSQTVHTFSRKSGLKICIWRPAPSTWLHWEWRTQVGSS